MSMHTYIFKFTEYRKPNEKGKVNKENVPVTMRWENTERKDLIAKDICTYTSWKCFHYIDLCCSPGKQKHDENKRGIVKLCEYFSNEKEEIISDIAKKLTGQI